MVMTLGNRVRDGVCESDMGVRDRISSTYKEGRGDESLSNSSVGVRSAKSDPSYGIHVAAEQVRLTISRALLDVGILTTEERYVMEWIRSSTFSVSSFCFCMGDSTRHVYPKEFLTYMEKSIEYSKEDIGGAKDFLTWDSIATINYDSVRVSIRELERAYIEWKLVNSDSISPLLKSNVDFMGMVINRMSSYVLWLTRTIGKREGVMEKCWSGKMDEFNPE